MGEVDEVTERIFDALDVVPRELTPAPMGLRDRGIEIKTPEQIALMRRRRPGRRRDPRAAARRRCAPAITTGELDAIAEDNIRAGGGDPVLPGLRTAVPGLDLRVGQRRGRARHPGRPGARRRRRRSRSTAARSSTAGTATPRSRSRSARCAAEVLELMRVTEELDVARHRRGPARRPGHRHLARRRDLRPSQRRATTASSRTTPATASARRCTSRRTCPTTAAPAAGPKLVRGLALAVEPMVTLGSKHTDARSTTTGPSSPPTAAGPRTSSTPSRSPRTAPGCSPRSTAARRKLAELGVPFGGA